MNTSCQLCSECCKEQYSNLVLTQQELNLLPIALNVISVGKNRFKAKGEVCPFLRDDLCSVYEIRPCQCRLFHCGKMDLTDKKIDTINGIREKMLANPEYMEYKTNMDASAIEWGNAHGWDWKKVNGN
jgi:Fe-S-cluster containining protein